MTRREQIRRRKKIRRIKRMIRANMPKLILAAGMIVIITGITLVKGISKSGASDIETQQEAIFETMQQATQQATVEKTETQKVQKFQEVHSMDWDAHESYLLAKIAMAEAEGESTEGKAMVIMVVLNRVFDSRFPGTIEEVIYQKNQFSPLKDGRWDEVEPDEDCWKALDLIMLDRWDESEGATYFEATYNGENTWHSRNLVYIKTIGKHNFYKEAEE